MEMPNSTRRWCHSRMVPLMSASDSAAAITTAASVGCGRSCSSPGRNSSITVISRGPDQAGQLRLRPGLLGHRGPRAAGADRESLEEPGRDVGGADADHLLVGPRPPDRCARRTPKPSRWCRSAPPAAMPSAPATSKGRSDTETSGMVNGGKPCGSTPTSLTPRAARSKQRRRNDRQHHGNQDGGHLGQPALQHQDITARPADADRQGGRRPSRRRQRPSTNPATSAIRPSASTENPNSFGSCPITIVSASPFM